MSQNDFVIDNGTGFAVREDIEDAFQALAGFNSGSSEPSTKYTYMFWADTGSSPSVMKIWSGSAWIELFQLDGTITLEDGTNSAPGLAFRSDLNTGLARLGADKMSLITGGSNRLVIDANGLIGMGVDDPTTFSADADNLVVAGSAAAGITIKSSTSTTGNLFFADGTSGNERFRGYVLYEHNNDKLVFGSQGTAIISAQYNPSDLDQVRVGIGHTAPDQPLHVKTEGEIMIKGESTDNANAYVQLVNTNSDGAFIGSEFLTSESAGMKDNLSFYVDNTSAQATRFMRLNSTHLEMLNGANIKLPALSGIDFSADGNTSGATSELFDDYEQGTFTPAMNQGINVSSYSQQHGFYVKVGNLVQVSFRIRLSGSGSSNHIRFQGLPINSANLTGYSSGGIVTYTSVPGVSGSGTISVWMGGNSSLCELYKNGNTSVVTGSGGFTDKEFYVVITYKSD
tara:strand:- start:936 stop:2300 length:1365 start_codon:yes stop_codon:yes gene_type:complete